MVTTIDDLTPNQANPRKITFEAKRGLSRSLEKFGDLSGITFNVQTKQLVCGHQRLNELKAMGGEYRSGSVWVGSREYPVRMVDWSKAFEREANVAANNKHIAGDWDETIAEHIREIQAGMSDGEFEELQFDALDRELSSIMKDPDDDYDKKEDPDGLYTVKVESPIYEPTRESPPLIQELCDTRKRDELVETIRASDGVPCEVVNFLEFAAARHVVFNYRDIAEYYAHADVEVQRLMEESALVIVDFKQAIENGFVQLTKVLGDAFGDVNEE